MAQKQRGRERNYIGGMIRMRSFGLFFEKMTKIWEKQGINCVYRL